MAVKRLQDIPIKPERIAQNRMDPRAGEGPFVHLVSQKDVEQVQLNGLTWNGDHRGYVDTEPTTARLPGNDLRRQGHRSSAAGQGGYNIVNAPVEVIKGTMGGNRSGE